MKGPEMMLQALAKGVSLGLPSGGTPEVLAALTQCGRVGLQQKLTHWHHTGLALSPTCTNAGLWGLRQATFNPHLCQLRTLTALSPLFVKAAIIPEHRQFIRLSRHVMMRITVATLAILTVLTFRVGATCMPGALLHTSYV